MQAKIISSVQFTEASGYLLTEASDLGLGVGEWPRQLITQEEERLFNRTRLTHHPEGWWYTSEDGVRLLVLND